MNYKGQLAGFPVEIVEKMLEYQVLQRNPRNVKLFEINNCASSLSGGFTWDDTPEGDDFWSDVIFRKNFERFFEKYPKQAYPKVMLVSDRNSIENTHKRVVFMEKNGKYIAWDSAKTLADAEEATSASGWKYAWNIPVKDNIIELTLEDIAKLKGVDVNRIRIKD